MNPTEDINVETQNRRVNEETNVSPGESVKCGKVLDTDTHLADSL